MDNKILDFIYEKKDIYEIYKYLILSIHEKHNFDAISKFYGIDKTTIRSWRAINIFSEENYKALIINYLIKCNIKATRIANKYLNNYLKKENTKTLVKRALNLSDENYKKMIYSKKEWKNEIISFFLNLNPYLFIYQINTIREELGLPIINKNETEFLLNE